MKAIVPSSLLLLAALLSIATLQVDPASAVAAPASSSKAKGAKKLRNKKNTNQNKNQQKKTNKNKKKTKNKNKKKTKNKKKNAKKTRSIVITTKDCTAVSNVATDDWCNTNCNHNPSFCPADLCTCDADGGDGDSTPSSSTTTTAPGSVPGPAPSPSTTTAAPVTKPPSDGADCVNIWTDKKCANRMQNAEGNGKLENMCTKWNAGLNCEKSCRARGFVHRDSTCDNPSATTTNAPSTSTAPAPSTTTTTRSTTTPSTTTPTPTPTPTPGGEEECQGGGAWANDVGMADWCKVNCPGPQCVTSGPGATCTEACNDNAEPSPAPPPSTPSTSTPAPVTPAPSPSTPAPGTPAPVPVTPAPAPSPLPPSSDDLIRNVVQVLESAPYEFQSLDPSGNGKRPSQLYKWQDMIKAVQSMAEQGVGDWKLFLGDAAAEGMDVAKKMGLANIAAFLAQSMKETIQYDACDENNWSDAASTGPGAAVYSAASACGQLGQSYQDYQCSAEDNNIAIAADGNPMACEVDPNMELRANTHAEWYGAPAAMFCAPKSKVPNAPRWDYASPWCPQEGGYGYERPRFDPSETWENWGSSDITDEFYKHVNSGGGCSDYLGQKAGGWSFTGSGCVGGKCANSAAPNFNRSARTDVEGCCWWGRGVIQTTGVCNFGKLNFYLGKRAKDLGKAALYPNIDFCRNPESICEPNSPPELKWTAGLFYWLASVQTYESDRYDFDLPALLRNVATNCPDGGASCTNAVTALNDATSGLVNRGCPSGTACSSGAVDGLADRLKNLQEILRAVGIIN